MADPRLRQVAAFYYDLGDPECWLVAERIASTLPSVPEFVPVIAGRVARRTIEAPDRDELAARARELELLPLRWPPDWPPDSTLAARAATYAARIGKVVAFSLAAFRQAFAGGRDLADLDTVLIAAAACEMHPAAVLKGVELRGTAGALEHACGRARAAGVDALPAITVGEQVIAGADSPERAAAILGS
jgi:2-hydroxychromene-2-carboxylate isomerase